MMKLKNLLIALLFAAPAWGGLPPTTLNGTTTFQFVAPNSQATQIAGVKSRIETGNKNLLANPNFEGTTGWTASGGATAAYSTSTPIEGLQSYSWDSNSAGQTLTSTAITIPAGRYGELAVASCKITTASGTATHTIEAYDGSATVGSAATVTSSTSPKVSSVNFTMPSSGTIALRLKSVNANEPSIQIDECAIQPRVTGTANHVLINDSSGGASSEASLAVTRGGTGVATLTAESVIIGQGTSAVTGVAPGASGNVLKSNGTSWTSTSFSPSGVAVAYIREEQSSGTNGGGTTAFGSYATRTLNTLVDPSSIVTSLASNQFTLPAGTYYLHARAPAYNSLSTKARLRNITAGTTTIIGQNSYCSSAAICHAEVEVIFTLAGATAFEIQQAFAQAQATFGMGVAGAFGDTEVYTQVTILKL